jgi:hypothetical protein
MKIIYLLSQLIGTHCGHFWAELIQSLVSITNSCDKAGTIANELPIVEQIPVSIHNKLDISESLFRFVYFAGSSSLRSFDSHDAIMGEYKSQRTVL